MKQNGNALVMILIAVGLFAALGMVFSNSTRTSSNFLTDEEAKAYANQIIAYGNEVKSAVKRLQLRGCSDTEISFENNTVAGYENPNSPTDKSCHVFDVAGGGLNFAVAPSVIKQDNQFGQYRFTTSPIGGGNNIAEHGTPENAELYFYVRGRLDQNYTSQAKFFGICQKINDLLDIKKYSSNLGELPNSKSVNLQFIGQYDDETSSNSYPEIAGYTKYCSNENTGYFNYTQILIAR